MMTHDLAGLADQKLVDGLRELANLRDETPAVGRFMRLWPKLGEKPLSMPSGFSLGKSTLPEPFGYVIVLRNCLREIWTGGPEANSLLTAFFVTSSPITELLPPGMLSPQGVFPLSPKGRFEADWRRGGLTYHPETDLQKALYLLLRRSGRAKVCANPECPAPYFVANKARDRYCSPACLQPFQRQWKRDWWNRVGSKRRATSKRKQKSRK
jgi:hypothetical protein